MVYSVTYVNDHDLSDDHDWAVAKTCDGDVLVFIKRSVVRPQVLAEAWAAARRLEEPRRTPLRVAH